MTDIRTSSSFPLRIDAVDANNSGGMIGMTICPGKCGDSQFGAAWNRDMATDIDAIRHWGATAVITALERDEMQSLGVEQLGTTIASAHLQWFHFLIADGAVPDERFDDAWAKAAPAILRELKSGNRVLIHCRGGLGRTGMLACLLLIELGRSPQDALRAVRDARPGTVETQEQEAFALKYRRRFS